MFGREDFRYEPDTDTYVCPGNKRLRHKSTNRKDRYILYKAAARDCSGMLDVIDLGWLNS